jgi:hypothetical protein
MLCHTAICKPPSGEQVFPQLSTRWKTTSLIPTQTTAPNKTFSPLLGPCLLGSGSNSTTVSSPFVVDKHRGTSTFEAQVLFPTSAAQSRVHLVASFLFKNQRVSSSTNDPTTPPERMVTLGGGHQGFSRLPILIETDK